ncbi:hypothetical protein C7974DRAFT_147717 [Boeremia exigua]|uniref:uncharacterized protein n=1 Tax=Boeremia exigua TaxID=749465 RepID=UPI001E8E9A77|nr:uncharacterized protein C7974DRAFT_147717 [Boeremia exigua]KAH6637749.1 hypothetical protein C7974DRAFT_147717 [Boeremia exigua]
MVPLRRASQRGRRSLDRRRDPFAWHDERDTPIMTATFPIHPLPSMQAAFEESMLDATGETGFVPFKTPGRGVKTRQQLLCREADAEELAYNYTYSCHWRHHPKGKHHPLLKTITQIVFGVHLLHQRLEKSTADVADILLKHVNELDSFLQRANEDLEQSMKDMLFRHKCLRVPMEHVNEFDRLLDDRSYRASLLDGNITIERTINRMSQLLNDYLVDISIYRDANHELEHYLRDIGDEWAYHNEDVGRIYSAMCGNTGGWAQFLQSLVTKAERLGTVLVQVSSYCNEIEKRCGAASRRSLIATTSSSRNSSKSNVRDNGRRASRKGSQNKPLPTPPTPQVPVILTAAQPDPRGFPDAEVRGRPISRVPHYQPQPEPVNPYMAGSRQQQVELPASSPAPASRPDVHVPSQPAQSQQIQQSLQSQPAPKQPEPKQPAPKQPEYHHEAWHNEEQSKATAQPQTEAGRMGHKHGHRRASNKEGDSPPVTAKDSAYSSLSGASIMSPTSAASPRSASSNAQFGLFPSSAQHTPKQSLSGRVGSITPSTSSNLRSVKSADPPDRPPTSASTYSETPASKRLLKRGSLQSLRRFFTKKKNDIHTIAE